MKQSRHVLYLRRAHRVILSNRACAVVGVEGKVLQKGSKQASVRWTTDFLVKRVDKIDPLQQHLHFIPTQRMHGIEKEE